eukprot:TRINITY_DN22990_c0_g1_i1.p5 TRINITY_DN22990_c0_g1~~TRINITY_DN22990_c0_g1_i1.p5  ORF type:complete len:144 (+),score=18.25 TRINITY_DN22990_c0_g1_i1:27-458(+)
MLARAAVVRSLSVSASHVQLQSFVCSFLLSVRVFFFFFNDTATTEIYTLHIVGSVRCVQETVSTQSTWDQGMDAPGHPFCIHHKDDRRPEDPGDMRSTGKVCPVDPVIQAHDPFDDGDVGAFRCPCETRDAPLIAHHERIDVA